jgi:hypothetical protein
MLFPNAMQDLSNDCSQRRRAITLRLQTELQRVGQVRFCQHAQGAQWICYIPTRFLGEWSGSSFVGRQEVQITSTPIRRILADNEDEEAVVNALSRVALNPGLLFDYIKEHKLRGRRRRALKINAKQRWGEGLLGAWGRLDPRAGRDIQQIELEFGARRRRPEDINEKALPLFEIVDQNSEID